MALVGILSNLFNKKVKVKTSKDDEQENDDTGGGFEE